MKVKGIGWACWLSDSNLYIRSGRLTGKRLHARARRNSQKRIENRQCSEALVVGLFALALDVSELAS